MKLSDRINAKVQIRNRDLVPHLENEGCFWRPLPMPRHTDEASQPSSISMISTHKRLFYHQTLNSARKTVHYQPYEDVIPQDSLDFALASIYDDKRQLHASKADVLVQMETAGFQTARRLRNTIDIIPEFEPDLGHPLIIGGTTMKVSSHSVKLAHSGHHTPLTKNGYSRQPLDGNIFNY